MTAAEKQQILEGYGSHHCQAHVLCKPEFADNEAFLEKMKEKFVRTCKELDYWPYSEKVDKY